MAKCYINGIGLDEITNRSVDAMNFKEFDLI